jgi:hypothetical protein
MRERLQGAHRPVVCSIIFVAFVAVLQLSQSRLNLPTLLVGTTLIDGLSNKGFNTGYAEDTVVYVPRTGGIMMNVLGVHTGEAGAWKGEDHWDDEMVGTERALSPEIDDPWVGRPHKHSSNIGAQPGHPMGFTINKYWAPVFAARMNVDHAFRPTQLAQLHYTQHPSISQQQLRRGEDGEAKLRVAGGGWRTVKLALLGAAEARGLDDCALYCTQEQPVQLLQSPKTKIIPNRPPRCGCPKPLPPPRLINGENCEDIFQNSGETSGVRWLIDCPDKWSPSRRAAPPKVTQQEDPPVGPDVSAHYADAIEMPPGEEEPEIEKDEHGCEPDIFAPQEPCWESNNNPGTKFTCFIGTKAHILTPEELLLQANLATSGMWTTRLHSTQHSMTMQEASTTTSTSSRQMSRGTIVPAPLFWTTRSQMSGAHAWPQVRSMCGTRRRTSACMRASLAISGPRCRVREA